MLDISFIIVSWNAKEHLLNCLRSLMSETNHLRTEIIVVDNASTDGSPEAIRDAYPSAKLVINETNLGFAKANNLGIKLSIGRYVCLINSDVIVSHDAIDRMLAYMDQQPGIGLLGPKVLNPDSTLQISFRKSPSLLNRLSRASGLDTIFHRIASPPVEKIRPIDVLSGCFWLIRREVFHQVGLLDENFFIYAEDLDLCKRLWASGWQVIYFPPATVVHYGGGSSSNAPIRFYLEQQRANLQYWQKHHNRLSQLGFFLIILFHQVARMLWAIFAYGIKPSRRDEIKIKIIRSLSCTKWLIKGSAITKSPGKCMNEPSFQR